MQTIPATGCAYEELGHTSEIGIRLKAASAPALFSCAAQAMFHLVTPVDEAMREEIDQSRTITVVSTDSESLLVDWLNELLYLYETSGVVFRRFTISTWEPTRLEATAAGGRVETPPAMHIKAVTYHQLAVEEKDEAWQAQVFFDI
jgi:SHS2 domain-containing protein